MGIFEKFRKNKKEVTPGGSPIYRYEEQENREFQMPAEMGRYAGEIEAQFAQLFPDHKSFVFHELLSDLVHIDVHVICPDEELPFYVLYTTGMSDLPMTLPEEIENPELYRRSELYLFLPGDWQLGKPGDVGTDIPPEYYWPIHLIKFLARFPHEYKTWLGWGHTMPNGPGYAPIGEGTKMGGVVLTAMDKVPPLKAKDGTVVNFYMVLPAYKEEIEYKLRYGMEKLEERFMEGKVSLVWDIQRPNLCPDFTEVLDGL